jgi:hypothetical protein
MAEFKKGAYGMVQDADLLQTGMNVTRPNDPLEGLFTDEMTTNLVAKWYSIASEYQIPQMAQFHAFDVEAQKSERAPIDEHNIEKGLIKVKRNTSELLRQLIGKGVNVESELYDFVMDDNANLADQVITRAKVARAELMATGKITIKENGLDATVDYGVPSNHLNRTIDVGEGASTDILAQFQTIIDDAADKGITINGMVCPRSFISKLRKNSSLQKAISGNVADGTLLRNTALNAFLNEEFGISQVITDDLTYSLPYTGRDSKNRPTVTSKRYYPNNKVTFFGTTNGARLGAGLWGTPPEIEIANFADVSTASASTYVYMTQWAEKDPAVIWTKASALYMPVLFDPNSLFVATIQETA